MGRRYCSRTGCQNRAQATLTYAYADSMAVLGPLAVQSDPGSYDLCGPHAVGLSAPVGWDIVRLPQSEPDRSVSQPAHDDLLALADAVREVGFSYDQHTVESVDTAAHPIPDSVVELARRGHLSVLTDEENRDNYRQ